eukprot:c25270_g1_i1.p1 GENE.c25270_g1_i1~~c25270_g1_i1.p1  ORF type:complete len:354 (-),score=90.97 c25270_g1_i1:30-1091(-)
MGACQSVQATTATDKAIEAELKKVVRSDLSRIRLLLLGPGQSGKSTIFKQVKILHKNGYSDAERAEFIPIIHQNIVSNILTLVEYCGPQKWNLTLSEDHERVAAEILDLYRKSQTVVVDQALAKDIKELWLSPQIQQAFGMRSKILMLSESAEYFFNCIDKVTEPNFVPSDEDILRARVRTTGICNTEFELDGARFEMCDVGGQRSERRRWINCFDNVQGVLFVAAINEYDQVLEEDGRTNRLHEALNVFEEVCNSRFFEETAMILFLNKKDLFAEKIKRVNITAAFPEYDGPQEYHSAVDYIRAQFESMNERDTKPIYTHITCATDTDQIEVVVVAVKDIMLNLNLQNSGFV